MWRTKWIGRGKRGHFFTSFTGLKNHEIPALDKSSLVNGSSTLNAQVFHKSVHSVHFERSCVICILIDEECFC